MTIPERIDELLPIIFKLRPYINNSLKGCLVQDICEFIFDLITYDKLTIFFSKNRKYYKITFKLTNGVFKNNKLTVGVFLYETFNIDEQHIIKLQKLLLELV